MPSCARHSHGHGEKKETALPSWYIPCPYTIHLSEHVLQASQAGQHLNKTRCQGLGNKAMHISRKGSPASPCIGEQSPRGRKPWTSKESPSRGTSVTQGMCSCAHPWEPNREANSITPRQSSERQAPTTGSPAGLPGRAEAAPVC